MPQARAPEAAQGNAAPAKSDEQTRRTFLRKVGDYSIALIVVAAAGNPLPADADATCSLTPHSSPNTNLHTTDSTCGGSGAAASPDEACGDCDDHHDGDQNCAAPKGGGPLDTDQLCGHIHLIGFSEDQVCGKANTALPGSVFGDFGCGVHDVPYNTATVDPDQAKDQQVDGQTWVHRDCTTSETDATCNANNPSYSTSPDEHCSTNPYEVDEACGQAGAGAEASNAYDSDEACRPGGATYDKDNSCGAGAQVGPVGGWDLDQACQKAGPGGQQYDKDETCGPKLGQFGNFDEACNKQPATWDTDNSCKMWVGGMMIDTYDTTCEQTRPSGPPPEGDGGNI